MSSTSEHELVQRLRNGDKDAFTQLVHLHHGSMVRIACVYVPNAAIAEEAAQETWLAVLRGMDQFEGRCAFTTWMYRILVNRARSIGERERRSIPTDQHRNSERAIDPRRFANDGAWAIPPMHWSEAVDNRLSAQSTLDCIRSAIDALPSPQREVIVLRDVEGLPPADVCHILDITDSNQRVLLHRARARLRDAIEQETRGTEQ